MMTREEAIAFFREIDPICTDMLLELIARREKIEELEQRIGELERIVEWWQP